MTMPPIFSPALNTQRTVAPDGRLQHSRKKRKRVQAAHDEMTEEEHYMLQKPHKSMIELEYTAVVSPLERQQRRVAGQPLDEPPPPFPFPHAGKVSTRRSDDESPDTKRASMGGSMKADAGSGSLHLQHLAALTAIVHRSLLTEDFARASRALGLMFREDIINRSAAIRNHGYMGVAAEVLLRQGRPPQAVPDHTPAALLFTREGFENAKRFYERLIIRHPYHKSWPGAVNAVDFYLAMFNLWIYVTHAENNPTASDMGEGDGIVDSSTSSPRIDRSYHHPQAKVRELEQANEIATRMDTCMATLPYMDEPELIRLRAMVALWVADLHDELSNAHGVLERQVFSDLLNESDETISASEHASKAKGARDLARDLLERLEGGPRNDE